MSTNGLKAVEAALEQFITNTEASFLQVNRSIDRLEQQAERDREEWKQQAEQDRKAWNKQWGETANRLGRVVEDIVAPNIPRIAIEKFNCPELYEDFSVRRKVYYKGQRDKQKEFDTLVVYPDTIILNETKETVRQIYLDDFVSFIKSGQFFDYFPIYSGRKLIPILSSLYLDESAVNYLTKHGIYALAMGDETMELLNFEQLKGK